MIEEIRIRDLGVIDEAVLPLHRGLTVLTGETGAGKTMVVTALGLLLGGRGDSALVRTGRAERAEAVPKHQIYGADRGVRRPMLQPDESSIAVRRPPAPLVAAAANVITVLVVVARSLDPLAAQAAFVAPAVILVVDGPMPVRDGSGDTEAQERAANEGCGAPSAAGFGRLRSGGRNGKHQRQRHDRMSELPEHGDHHLAKLTAQSGKMTGCRKQPGAFDS